MDSVPSVEPADVEPSDVETPDAEPPVTEARAANRRTRAATLLMWPALAALVASAVLFLLPVSNPGVQDCGSPAVFLLTAKTNRPLVDADETAINGWDRPRILDAYENRCSVRVAHRAVPAGALLVGFWIIGLVALMLARNGRRALRRAAMDV